MLVYVSHPRGTLETSPLPAREQNLPPLWWKLPALTYLACCYFPVTSTSWPHFVGLALHFISVTVFNKTPYEESSPFYLRVFDVHPTAPHTGSACKHLVGTSSSHATHTMTMEQISFTSLAAQPA
jgi:hypothetical protein